MGDGAAVTIHHPTARTLLNAGVRVLRRTLQKATRLLGQAGAVAQATFVDGTQGVRAQMKRIMEVARQQGDAAAARLKTPYRDRVALTTPVGARAKQVQAVLTTQANATVERGRRR